MWKQAAASQDAVCDAAKLIVQSEKDPPGSVTQSPQEQNTLRKMCCVSKKVHISDSWVKLWDKCIHCLHM